MFMFIINSSDCNYKEEIALHTSRHNEQSDRYIGLVEDVTHPSINKKIHNNTGKYQMEINRNENEHIDRDTVYILINSS